MNVTTKMFLVLSVIADNPGKHPYMIHKLLVEDISPSLRKTFLGAAMASTYVALKQLEKIGLVSARTKGKEERQVYYTTDTGRKVLRQLWSEVEKKKPARVGQLVRA